MKRTYKIDELYGNAWICAIENIMDELNSLLGMNLTHVSLSDETIAHELAKKLNVRFDEYGDIIRN